MSKIHKTAIIEDGAIIEDDVEIGAFSIITGNVIIKSGTKIYSHVRIEGKTTIGHNNETFSLLCIFLIDNPQSFVISLDNFNISSLSISFSSKNFTR